MVLYNPFYEGDDKPHPGHTPYEPLPPYVPPPQPNFPVINPHPPVPTPEPTGGGGGGGKGGGGGGGGYAGPIAPDFNFKPVPGFTPPPAFQRPNPDQLFNSPGYQFRVNQGNQALQNSAAAKGLTRTGGTLKDFIDYNQNFASQEYGQEFNRARDIYDRTYQAQKDQFAPKLAEWQTLSQAEMAKALAAYQRPWEMYMFQHKGGGGGSPAPIPPAPTPPELSAFNWDQQQY